MKRQNLKVNAILLLFIGLSRLYAQETVTTSGNNASGNGGSVSYTIGQVFYNTNLGTNGFEVQGVQQPIEISVITGIDESKGIILKCSLFPNPTNDFLTLEVENYPLEELTFQLYDINGKLLKYKRIDSNITNIIAGDLTPSTYILKVFDNDKEIKIFKIIKN